MRRLLCQTKPTYGAKQYKEDADGSCHYQIEVVEHTKSDAGYRTIYVVSSALEIFAKIKEFNLQRGFSCDAEDYIFIYRNKRITSQAIEKSMYVIVRNWDLSKRETIRRGKHV